MVNRRSDTDLGNTQSAPRGGERATVFGMFSFAAQIAHVGSVASPYSVQLGLYKIFVYFEAVVHESSILSFPPPTCIVHPGGIRFHDYWTVYDFPSALPFVCCTPYNIVNSNIV